MKIKNPSLLIVAGLVILLAAFSRIVLFPYNFSPILAMCIFFGAIVADKKMAFAMPLLAMLLSDIIFEAAHRGDGFWGWGQLLDYGIFAMITVFAFSLKKINLPTVLGFTIGGSLLFFLLSNSVFFFVDNTIYHLYANSFQGYLNCLEAGLPFIKNSLTADISYSAMFFGTYYLLNKYAFSKLTA
ncbi:MAG: DUF6580 family putative transport protein [Chitinophagaceae bacterium]